MVTWNPPFNETVFRELSDSSCFSSDRVEQAAVADTTPAMHNGALPLAQIPLSFEPLFPASYRKKNATRKPFIVSASCASAKTDLSVEKLNEIYGWLWLAGRPMPPRPLNYQQASSREIILNENVDMHLVWDVSRRIFLKPLPRYLLSHKFWQNNLATDHEFYKSAFGFMLSYAALIQYESDFFIAKEKHLIPENLTWESWINLVDQLLNSEVDNRVNSRYRYGELRLSRLNKILWMHGYFRGYSFRYQTYGELLTANLAPIAAATVYIALVLTAMQVGLATPQLADNDTFQRVSYGFAVFSILAPAGVTLFIVLILILFFFYNSAATIIFRRKARG
ncbi:uncharacterized protein FMAN_15380 [Fusarium mangiferae]|uniref:Subtilisin-like serine protease n=1 Tax=Fusarium mangiferae TaxID=192010 RepID=A0A1L7U9A5_FUSMA|nr:uncharacterized protein FMAN_15380 [Fusarium mangiferae]CVL07300.1 uncharacterized protein FMAN_15380 [Fusarium mangiferae]